jgi:hypothetical protein
MILETTIVMRICVWILSVSDACCKLRFYVSLKSIFSGLSYVESVLKRAYEHFGSHKFYAVKPGLPRKGTGIGRVGREVVMGTPRSNCGCASGFWNKF